MKYILIMIVTATSCIGNEPEVNEEAKLEVLWSRHTNNIDAPDTEPLIIENSKIIYTGEIDLVAVNIENGEEQWRGTIDNERALISDKLLYDEKKQRVFANHMNDIKVWDSKTGELLFTLTEESGVQAFSRGKHVVLDEGYGIIGDTLDAYVIESDGEIRYSIQVPFASAGLAFSQNKLYMTMGKTIHGLLTRGKIIAFDSQNKDSLWGYNTDKGGFNSVAPVVENGILYAGTVGNSPEKVFVALDAETGEVIWEYITEEQREYTESLIIGLNFVYSGAGGALVALDKLTGEKVWRFDWTSSTLVKPVYLEGYVYHSDHNRLFVIDAETGELVHEEPLPEGGGFFWHLAVSKDKLFAQTSRQLIAYQPWHLRE